MTIDTTEARVAALSSVNEDFAKLAGEQRLEIARLREALEHIDTMCTEEINARWPPSMRSGTDTTKGSRIYPLLDMPRRIARAALKEKAKAQQGAGQ